MARKSSKPSADDVAAARERARLERDLAAMVRRCNAREGALNDALEDRDLVIREMIAARVPRARIVEITGLSLQRIDQIRRRTRR
ncbi:MAG: hypothetical protein ABSB73_14205 [Solirubrobacteraceae bacterium]|jgi:hypothetical protein